MANELHLLILKQGPAAWNQWRQRNPEIEPELSEADLVRANLSNEDFSHADLKGALLNGTNLSGSNLSEANLFNANLMYADLRRANLNGADLSRANLNSADSSGADLSGANLNGANLSWAKFIGTDLKEARLNSANLVGADLSSAILVGADLSRSNLSWAKLIQADLSHSDLTYTNLIETNLEKANLTSCSIYGISAWGLKLEEANQSNLIITHHGEAMIMVDNFAIAQFVHLLLHNHKIRHIIKTVTSKIVLIAGRFMQEKKDVLDSLQEELRRHDYLPIFFNLEKTSHKEFLETLSILALLSRFIIVDLTDAISVLHEIQSVIEILRVPVQPLLESAAYEYDQEDQTILEEFQKNSWALKLHRYESPQGLLASFGEIILGPAESKARELEKK
jgi:uncharacterized protein YjbI with pentapeptide repeats